MEPIIYDDEAFFDSYAQLPRSRSGLSAAPEWGALKDMVGSVKEKKVIDLGCGYGWFCRWAHESWARSVAGIDISNRMLSRAREMGYREAINYQQADITGVEITPGVYDLVYSSLALHYLAEIETLLRSVFQGLRSGGRFVFSVEHPVWTAMDGWFITKDGELPIWPLNQYADEGKRTKRWLGFDVVKHHRKLDTYVSSVLRTGFILRGLVEWTPSKEDLEAHPEWSIEVHRPAFLLIAAEKP